MNSEQRIVITGMGAISPVGLNCQETFDSLVAGQSGVSRVSLFDPSRLKCQVAGEVKGFEPEDHMDRKLARRIGRYAQFSIAATQEALAQSGLDLENEDRSRIACVVSSAIGDFPMVEKQMGTFFSDSKLTISPFTVPRVSTSMAAGNIALQFGLTGLSYGVSSACATGSHSLATAMMILKLGLADIVLAGGSEAAICETFLQSYIAMRALSTRNDEPERASRPFDRDRDGFVIAEGCGVMVLETVEHAQRRDAPILAELVGAGMTCDAFHITSAHPDGMGAAQAMTTALNTAGLDPEERNRFHNLLVSLGEEKVIILSTHIVDDVSELCSNMAVLGDGKILLEGNPLEVTDKLNGKIWRKIVSSDEAADIESEFAVISKRLLAGRTVLHVLSDAAPTGFESTPANLEDVYFSTLIASRNAA